VFNGPINRGYNRTLAIDLFTTGRVTEKVVEGQRRSDEAQARSSMRMGYMGHLTLIAEEVVKFTERHPPEFLSKAVLEMVMAESWVHYVEQVLAETRERDNAILGGVRPEVPPLEARQAAIQSLHAGQNLVFGNNHGSPSAALLNAGLTAGAGGGAAAAITAPGLDTAELIQGVGGSSSQNGAFGFGSGSLLADLSGAAHGGEVDDEDDDDEDDEDMAGNHRNEAGDRTQYRGEEANQVRLGFFSY
jgi:SIT4-associating protein SAP185/190